MLKKTIKTETQIQDDWKPESEKEGHKRTTKKQCSKLIIFRHIELLSALV